MNIQYLNLPPYPNRWMVWLIQQGLACRPGCVKTCCQEDGIGLHVYFTHTISENQGPIKVVDRTNLQQYVCNVFQCWFSRFNDSS